MEGIKRRAACSEPVVIGKTCRYLAVRATYWFFASCWYISS